MKNNPRSEVPKPEIPILFEDWYIQYTGNSEEEMQATLGKDSKGDYKVNQTYWMHKAFLAGQVLREKEQ